MRLLVAGLALFASATVHAADVRIEHSPVGCAVAGRYPVIDAHLEPADFVSRAAIHFHAGTGTEWYAVALKPHGPAFQAVLPRPKKKLDHFEYYVEVVDRAFGMSRTPAQTVHVSGDPTGCRGQAMAGAVDSAALVVEGPGGAPVVPAGFGSAGVSSAAAATEHHLGGLAITGIVAGSAALFLAALPHEFNDNSPEALSANASPDTFYQVSFGPPPGLDVSVCVGHPLSWSSQVVSVPGGRGTFDLTWSPLEPNVLHVNGTVSPTGFNAVINCVSGAAAGTLTAIPSASGYQGSFVLGTQHGSITVTQQH